MPICVIFENQAVDLINAVMIPVLISTIVGIPLAIYTGLVAARILAFSAERQKARTELIFAAKKIRDYVFAADQTSADTIISGLLVDPIVALQHEQEQNAAAEALATAAEQVMQELKNLRITTFRVSGGFLNVPPKAFAEIGAAIDVTLVRLRRFALDLGDLRPDYWTVAYMPTFGTWAGKVARLFRGPRRAVYRDAPTGD